MEKNFFNDDFENFLQRSAEGLRMRPSEKVWKGISKKLSRSNGKMGISVGSIMLAICTLGYFAIEPAKLRVQLFEQGTSLNSEAYDENTAVTSIETNTDVTESTPVLNMLSSPLAASYENYRSTALVLSHPLAENNQKASENDFIPDNDPELKTEATEASGLENKIKDPYPQTIESVVNLRPKTVKKKTSLQFYFTPTASYRKLSENKTFLRSQNALALANSPAQYKDVNSMVTHRPDLGFEMGMAARYPLTRNLNLRAGIQFNVSRFGIRAYNTLPAVATLFLNTRDQGVDSIMTLARHSNEGMGQGDWLENFSLQLSAPIGVEYIFAGNSKVNFGVATTIQPTYVLGGRSYMITPDYKTYTQVPDLLRNWNVNTSIETFVGYSTGKLNWQIGPQLRYQLLSSFENEYPVKENLFNYGLKIGITRNSSQ
jgi:hypothetical protein